MSELDDIVKEFLIESHEGLDRLDRDLVALEQRPRDQELLAGIFRCIHTIKGTCGFLGFGQLESVSHEGESLLSLLRDGHLALTPAITSALLALVDAVREILGHIEASGVEGDTDYSALVQRLSALQEPESAEPAIAVSAADDRRQGDRRIEDRREADRGAADPHGAGVSDSNIRVDVVLLDKLMNLVGELVLARNQVLQFSNSVTDSAFLATSQRLNLITTELQEGVMKTRMQPIGNIWSKFPRVVRDLAVTCGKQVAIELEGQETELDKTIIEAIKDPLTHVVRNSVDHGIESPERRRAAGKPAEGRLHLRAYHEGGQVNIEISDDGGGIDGEKVKQKAVERGLVTAEQAARMSEREMQHLIFLPGFSTAAAVTNVSGRGVGMDVVKTNIERIGGTVDVQSVAGQGTTLKIKIPLTLAIIPALVVTVGAERFAIPQVNLLELVRADESGMGIELMHDAPVYRLRGALLPLLYLSRELQLPSAEAGDAANIVVLQADGRQFGLVVDEINDTEEIVVKPLGSLLKGIPVFAGATIMGDGRVALILDVLGLAQRAHVVGATRERTRTEAIVAAERRDDRQSLLVFDVGERGRMAIPLSLVARLEEIPRHTVERAAQGEVVQYRGEIMPLIRLSVALATESVEDPSRPLQVVVSRHEGRHVGLIVDCISDIVEEDVTVVEGSAVIQQRVTDLVDVPGIVRRSCPWLFAARAGQAVA